jgi:hypothetical protein
MQSASLGQITAFLLDIPRQKVERITLDFVGEEKGLVETGAAVFLPRLSHFCLTVS